MGMYNITWSDAVINFWTDNSSPNALAKINQNGTNSVIEVTKSKNFRKSLTWKKGKRIFTNPNSDFFSKDGDVWRSEAWDIIKKTPHHTWQILTSNPERVLHCLPPDWGEGYANVWIGVPIETSKHMHRLYTLGNIPVAERFIFADQLHQKINFGKHEEILDKYQRIILGEHLYIENDKIKKRKSMLDWATDIIFYFSSRNIHVFIKRSGVNIGNPYKLKNYDEGVMETLSRKFYKTNF